MAHKVPKVVVTVLEVIIQVFRWAGKLGSGLSSSLLALPLPSALRSLAEAPTPVTHAAPFFLPLPALPSALRSAFGTKVVPPQATFKALPSLFESKDGKAREKVKDLVVSQPSPSNE